MNNLIRKKFTILRCLIICIGFCILQNISFGQIDTSITISKAGENFCPITLIYRVEAKSFTEPFHWTFVATDIKGKLIFSDSVTDSFVEPMLKEKDIMPGCNDYTTSKNEYYFKQIPARVLQFHIVKKSNGVFDRTSSGGIYSVFLKYLKKTSHNSQDENERIVDAMVEMLQTKGGWVLSIPISPLQDKFPLVYYPPLNQFVPFYEW